MFQEGMPEESLIVGAVVGALVTKGADLLVSGGSKLLERFRGDHRKDAEETTGVRIASILEKLDQRLDKVENGPSSNREAVGAAMSSPDFAGLLQDTLTGAATAVGEMNLDLLADLVGERLKSDVKDADAILYRVACSAISEATPLHLELLGSLATVDLMDPNLVESALMRIERPYLPELKTWFEDRMASFPDYYGSALEEEHLRAIRCLKDGGTTTARVNTSPRGIATLACFSRYDVPIKEFRLWRGGERMTEFLHTSFATQRLTSVGRIVGALVVNRRWGTSITYRDFLLEPDKYHFRSSHPKPKYPKDWDPSLLNR